MSELKGKAVIGAFVVGAIALAVAAVLVLGGGEFMKKKFIRVMYFDGSVKGLKVGAPVVFQGVQVGTVKEISVQANPEKWTFKVPVIVELDPAAYRDPDLEIDQEKTLKLLIEKGLRAKLELQSLVTGMLQVALDFNPDTEARLVGGDTPYPEIPTEQSSMRQLASTIKELPIKELIGQFSDTLASIRGLLNSPELRESLQHLNEALVSARDLVRHADAELVAKASTLLEDADRMIVNIDGQLRPVLAGAGKTVADIDKLVLDVNRAVVPLARKVEKTVDAVTTSAETIRPAIKQAEKALANIESMTRRGANERESLDDALKELSAAARSIKNWAEYLERHPEALIRGKAQSARR